jgi:predicted enzyme related to lactoylglutathione lyase
MLVRDDYLPGVPCWIDLVQPDFERTTAFYGALFDWTFETRTPPGAPVTYTYARRDGQVAAGIGGGSPTGAEPGDWTQYICVTSADDTVAAIEKHGGAVLSPPADIPRAGRVAVCADPSGARIGLWQPAETRGVQLVNAHGSWNFSELHTPEPEVAIAFYREVFGWECDRLDFGAGATWLWRVPGYGDFLAKSDPELGELMDADQAPDGFADAVAWMEPYDPTVTHGVRPHWSITFAVADADAAFERATSLGAEVVVPAFDTEYTRQGTIRDPQGAVSNLSEYRPPQPS